ncbi:unnamed protein product [Polarella glacialis]|uniref:Uncharacterized protein n=1 Tax=Polarella glacialis TaxID=89957 RepID=A0A813LBX9_POLGL|nr:unnamed protein product [Polarella glacialis]
MLPQEPIHWHHGAPRPQIGGWCSMPSGFQAFAPHPGGPCPHRPISGIPGSWEVDMWGGSISPATPACGSRAPVLAGGAGPRAAGAQGCLQQLACAGVHGSCLPWGAGMAPVLRPSGPSPMSSSASQVSTAGIYSASSGGFCQGGGTRWGWGPAAIVGQQPRSITPVPSAAQLLRLDPARVQSERGLPESARQRQVVECQVVLPVNARSISPRTRSTSKARMPLVPATSATPFAVSVATERASQAVRALRDLAGCSLQEAKEALIEAVAAQEDRVQKKAGTIAEEEPADIADEPIPGLPSAVDVSVQTDSPPAVSYAVLDSKLNITVVLACLAQGLMSSPSVCTFNMSLLNICLMEKEPGTRWTNEITVVIATWSSVLLSKLWRQLRLRFLLWQSLRRELTYGGDSLTLSNQVRK